MFITCNYQSKKLLLILFVRFISHKLEYINALRFYSDHTNVRPASLHHYWQSLQVSPMRHFLWQESFHLTHLCILTARNPRQEQTTFIVHIFCGRRQQFSEIGNGLMSLQTSGQVLYQHFHIKLEGMALAEHFYCRSNGHHPTGGRVGLTGGFI